VASAGNTSGYITWLDHPDLNGDPAAIFFIAQVLTDTLVYNDHTVAVYYEPSNDSWAIFNEDGTAMDAGASFNVVIPPPGADVFKHEATAGNTSLDATFLDHPALNDLAGAQFFVTQHWAALGSGVYNTSEIGLYYNSGTGRWAVYNEDGSAMPAGAGFNVWVTGESFVWTSTLGNIVGDRTVIDHPSKNGDGGAVCLFNHVYNPGGGPGIVYNEHLGFWFDGSNWTIFDIDNEVFLAGSYFFVNKP
jgi:hypothetical protein